VKFVPEGDKVAGALRRDLRAGKEHIIKARAYVAAGGVICQSHTFCQIVLRRTLIDQLRDPHSSRQGDSANTLPIPLNDPDPQITIPYSAEYPYHTQLHRDAFSYGDVGPQIDHRVVLDLRFFGRADVRESNHVSFSNMDRNGRTNTDVYGMPQPTFHFQRSSDDDQRAQRMMKDMCDTANILGSYLPTAPPQFIVRLKRIVPRLPNKFFSPQKAPWHSFHGHDPSWKRPSYISSR
ncbi:hypothetical protein FRC06_009299, partial [Ceratobasidium sp. 370]